MWAKELCGNHYAQNWWNNNPDAVKKRNANNNKKYAEDEAYRENKKATERERSASPQGRATFFNRYHSNPDYHHKMRNDSYKRVKLDVLSAYSKKDSGSDVPICRICGEKEILFLTIDHIDGRKAINEKRGNQKSDELYRKLRREHYQDGYQVLCQNCNMKKEKQRPKTKVSSDPKKEYNRLASKKSKLKLRHEVLSHYSNGAMKCACCGIDDEVVLSIDHIHGRKNAGHKEGISSYELYTWLRQNGYPPICQVLCMNCNAGKRESGKCPHQKSQKTAK